MPITGSGVMTVGVPATGSPRVISMRRTTSNTSKCTGSVGGTAGFGATSVFTTENTSVSRPSTGLAGNGGATGVAAAGSTATGVGATARVGAAAVTCGATVAVAVDADLTIVKSRNAGDLVTGSGAVASMTVRAAAAASA